MWRHRRGRLLPFFQKDNVAVVNGLDIPVTVTFVQSDGAEATAPSGSEGTGVAVADGTGSADSDPAPFEVPAGGHFATRLSKGTYTAEVRNGDQILQVETFEVGSDASLSVINVLGAAPIYLHEVIYTTGVTPPSTDWMNNAYMNRRFVAVTENIDHFFEEPPEEIEISGTSESRWFFGFIPPTTAPLTIVSGTHMFEECQINPVQPGCGVSSAGHWTISVSWLQYWGRTLEAQQLVRVIAQVEPDNEEVARWSQSLGITLPPTSPQTTPNALPADGVAPYRPEITPVGSDEDK